MGIVTDDPRSIEAMGAFETQRQILAEMQTFAINHKMVRCPFKQRSSVPGAAWLYDLS
jgi:hypothetical protein